jgi:Holliday junction DNA helicase RuvA
MIGHISGKIIHRDLKSAIVDVSGTGYKVYMNTASLDGQSEKTDLWTYLSVRENALDLYGFKTKEELDFFELLLTVSGIGPKSAMAIISTASLSNLRRAIAEGDVGHLTKVSGVGRKNAEKIVLELKDKIEMLDQEDGLISGDIDALEALQSLGYNERLAREALKKVSDAQDAAEKVKRALKLLS